MENEREHAGAEPTEPSGDALANPSPASTEPPAGPIVARAGRYYRNTRLLMVLLVLGFGIACIYDGWVRWPRQNRELEQVDIKLEAAQRHQDQTAIRDLSAIRSELKIHTAMDLRIQKALGMILPPLAILLLIRALYISRGEYRLEEDVLHVPGHPPIPLEQITDVDQRLWDRKGILYFDYQLSDQKSGRVKLDDYVYAREPTDKIVDRIKVSGAERSVI
jgi:hypothetical protein